MSTVSQSSVDSSASAPLPPTAPLSLIETPCVLCGASDGVFEADGIDFEYATCANRFRFVRCPHCDHLYLNPRPRPEDLGTIYPSNYYAYAEESDGVVSRLRRRWEGGKVRLYRDLIGAGSRRLLDIGCGNGRFLALLDEFGSSDWELEGIDFDTDAAEQCRARGFRTHIGRVEEFDPGDRHYDAVIMLQLIEHVEDPAAIAKRVYSLLRPGGVFIIETPNTGGLDYRLFKRSWWGHYHFPRHWNLFSTTALQRLLGDCGFAIERTDYLISTSAWTISLHNYFLDKGYPQSLTRFFHYQNPLLLALFVLLDTLRAKLGGQTSNQRMVARRPGQLPSDDVPTALTE
ncbi:MAG: class I SAM-dependent methyltransferase [Myxococcota bacterium]